MRKGETFVRRGKSAQDHWERIERKVHPALLEMAGLFKECIQGLDSLRANAPKELVASIEAKFENGCDEIFRRFSGPVQPPKGYFPYETISAAGLATHSEEVALAEVLHWERHKVSHSQEIERLNNRDGNAARRIVRTMAEYEGIRCDKKKPKAFKGKIDHSNIFGFGLRQDWKTSEAKNSLFSLTVSALAAAKRTMQMLSEGNERNSFALSNKHAKLSREQAADCKFCVMSSNSLAARP